MTPEIWAALIAQVGILGAAVLQQRGLRRDVREVKHRTRNIDTQVTNSHAENFRDEVTRSFDEMKDRLDAHGAKISVVQKQVSAVDRRLTKHIDLGGA